MQRADEPSTVAIGRSAILGEAERPISSLGCQIVAMLGPDFRSRMSQQLVFERAFQGFKNQFFTWNDLNHVLNRRSVFPADLQLSHHGDVLPRAKYLDSDGLIDLHQLSQLVRGGASIIVDGLDRVNERVRDTTTDIMRLTGEVASCNLFVTFDASQAFHSHFDEIDTVIVQLEGTKHWQVHGPSEKDPLPEFGDSDPSNCPSEVLLDAVLEPGDVLHVPRGWWHTVRGAGSRSLHVTFAFTRKTGFDFVRWLAWKALGDERIRKSLDRWGSAESRNAQRDQILASFINVAESLTVDDFFEEEVSSADGWQSASLPWSITDNGLPDDLKIRVLAVFAPPLESNEETLKITFAGNSVTLPKAYEPILNKILEVQNTTIDALAEASGTPRRAVADLVRQLQVIGLVELI
ncbi:Ribosomal protein L16 Arg81 hydroxylase, contains JmjC domain [Brevibacterium sandarakinum]|uniref:Ribosomal protein L16 Arg81 hydroxylase, contains JmjC domain n=1 Tax=Brevibacterium sandarakinum TaxID=629680 RepID=A0A1H1NJG7_BRESA|nr:cupin domain-containing protein [Brevibacterium sandarakinum]SDR99098.1 Ribosomal protein L16 Arg81 hydroxylase, contains JmjC domain [Brevibacterium sandarakinum]